MIPTEVKTPQISVREKYSPFAFSSNQATACPRSTPGPDSLETAASMLVLHCGSLYRDDMALNRKDRDTQVKRNCHGEKLSSIFWKF